MIFSLIVSIIAVVSGVFAYTEARKAEAAAKKASEGDGILVSRHDNNAGLRIIYGERAVGAIKTFKGVSRFAVVPGVGRTVVGANSNSADATTNSDSKQIWLDRIDVIGQGPIHSLSYVEIDNELSTVSRFSRDGLSHYRGIFMDGSPGQTALTELSAVHSQWKSSAVGNRVAYMNNRFRFANERTAYRGEPDVTMVVKGLLIWDPRKDNNYGGSGTHVLGDLSTYEWSDNPSLCLLDYLLADYGRNLSISEIDLPSFIAAANKCEVVETVPPRLTNTTQETILRYDPGVGELIEILPGGALIDYRPFQDLETSFKRMKCDVVLDPKNKVIDNVKTLLETMKANLPYSNGKYSLVLEDSASPVESFDENDILPGLVFGDGDASSRMNRVTVKFPNKYRRFKQDQVSWPELSDAQYATYLAEDSGKDLHQTVSIQGVTDYYRAADIAEFIVRDSRASLATELTVKSKGMQLQPGDVVTVTHSTPGWVNKPFRVRGVKIASNFTAVLALTEYQESTYPWSDKNNEPDHPDVSLPTPYVEPAAVSGLTVSLVQTESASGVPQGRADVSWTLVEDEFVDQYLIRYKTAAMTSWLSARANDDDNDVSLILPTDNATYTIEVFYRNVQGQLSATNSIQVAVPQYRTDLDVELHDLEFEAGGSLQLEGGNLFNLSDLSDIAQAVHVSNVDLQNNIDTVQTQVTGQLNSDVTRLENDISGINEALFDLTIQTGSIFVQAAAPVAGVGGVPDPIPDTARWYDSDDNNAPYYWNGTAWTPLSDGRIANNASAITVLQSDMTTAQGDITTNANAISVLDTTSIAQGNQITSIASDVTTLQTDLDAAEVTILGHTADISANSSAVSSLDSRVTSAEGTITSQASDITSLQVNLASTDGNVSANGTAISGLDTRLIAAEDAITSSSSSTVSLSSYIQFIRELDAEDGSPITTEDNLDLEQENLSNVAAASGTAINTLGTEVSLQDDRITAQSQQITLLQSDLTSLDGTAAGTASALSALETRVTSAEGTITSSASDITSLQAGLVSTDGTVAANGSAISALDTRVTSAEGTITSQSSDITTLSNDLTTAQGDISSTSTALSALTTRVTTAEGTITSQSADITALESGLTTAQGDISSTSTALGSLTTRVTSAEGTITSQSADITSLESSVTAVQGTSSANAGAISALDTRVTAAEGTISSQSTSISSLQASLSNVDTDTQANASAIGVIDTRVTNAEGLITSQASSISSLNTTVGNNSSTISTQQTSINGIHANYAVKLDVNGRVTGFGLTSTSATAIPTSEFVVIADKFSVVDPASTASAPIEPFTVSSGLITLGTNVRVSGDLVTTGTISADRLNIDGITLSRSGDSLVVNQVDATQVATGQLNPDRINVDTLLVKKFANFNTEILDHRGIAVPLTRRGQAYKTTTSVSSGGTFIPVTITQCRSGGSYVAIFQGVLGDVSGGKVQISYDNVNWTTAAGGPTSISWSAGTFRGYTYTYTGTLSMTGSQSNVYFRVAFTGSHNHTYLGLNVLVFNTG